MIISTAGHVDHGKTLLVKALTGVDTDRLPEEKRRNLTIDLGFAYLPLPSGEVLGFVDVPGHERFIRNMLCGVASIDFVLFIVAADDGPMPQTREHLAILDLLGVSQGAVALTKTDRVDPERVDEVGRATAELFAETTLTNIPIFPVSAMTGDGIDALGAHLEERARAIPPRETGGNFRLAVDRCFSVVGAGVVVTGTVFAGSVHVGEELIVTPQNRRVRVRGIHAQDRKSERGVAGERCALNLAGSGVRREMLSRGDWIVAPAAHNPVRRIDAALRVPDDESRPLANWTPVHIHLAAADVTGRVAVLEGSAIEPGESSLVQLVLDRSIGACHGDGLILRDQSARRTIAGGTVVDVFPPQRGRARPERLAYLRAMTKPDGVAALTDLVAQAARGLNLVPIARCNNLTADEATRLWDSVPMIRIGAAAAPIGFAENHWQTLAQAVKDALNTWHARSPDSMGATEQNLLSVLAIKLRPAVLAAAIPRLERDGVVVRDGTRLRLPGHAPELKPEDTKFWERVQPLLDEGGLRPMSVTELADRLGADGKKVASFLARAARMGLITQVAKNRYFPPPALRELADIAEQIAAEAPGNQVTAAAFRDRSGIGRNLTIEVLEFFDRVRFTRRVGDGRVIARPAAEAFGVGEQQRRIGR